MTLEDANESYQRTPASVDSEMFVQLFARPAPTFLTEWTFILQPQSASRSAAHHSKHNLLLHETNTLYSPDTIVLCSADDHDNDVLISVLSHR